MLRVDSCELGDLVRSDRRSRHVPTQALDRRSAKAGADAATKTHARSEGRAAQAELIGNTPQSGEVLG